MQPNVLTHQALERALHLRDLTNPLQGSHAMQLIVTTIHTALANRWGCQRYLHRTSPIVSVEDNYNRLGYPADGAARDARYTRYVTAHYLL
jgi:phenylalanyl-tRNA synthetase alpha chain